MSARIDSHGGRCRSSDEKCQFSGYLHAQNGRKSDPRENPRSCQGDPSEDRWTFGDFLAGISAAANVPAVLAGTGQTIVSDPQFTHWVVEQERLVGEAHSVEAAHDGMSFAYVRLFSMPELAERGYIATAQLRTKNHES